ncbi:MAG: transglutaminase domain-containing protein, partial [Burkholderiales bacterium]|nr:transglutaminase domain-containing protein [Burkholderiales bacterium]
MSTAPATPHTVPPRLLLGAAALLWGWQTGFWPLALAAALALEAPHWSARRVDLDPARQRRVGDLAVVLAALVGVGCYVAYGNPRAIVLFFLWLPVALLPVGLMHAWGSARALGLDVLFWGLRSARAGPAPALHPGYAYFVLWLVGAAAANQRGAAATGAAVALGAWALLAARRDRSRPGLWALEIALVAALGSALHVGLHGAQLWLEGAAPDWMTGAGGTRTNPYRASTDLGTIGALRQSGNIVLRVAAGGRLDRPLLLHRASYNDYGGTAWVARGARFAEVPRAAPAAPWSLRPGAATRTLTIAEHAAHGNPVLALPAGALSVDADIVSLKANTLGAVQAEAAPGWVIARVGVGDGPPPAAPPGPGDLAVPARERAAIDAALAEFGLGAQGGADAVAALRRGFAARFAYATTLAPPRDGRTALAEFLLRTRAGHCEYFASATVLLLRAAGVPARYATGFSVQEFDAARGDYVVRERHAHAWARAWIGGAWVDVDTTPPDWAAREDLARPAAARWQEAFVDTWSLLRYRYALWQRDSSPAQKWA